MLKGISRRVIVVKSPDRRFFEEAIFIVKEGAIGGAGGVTAEQVVEEARRVADGFVKKSQRKWYQRLPATGYMIVGALIATVVCCLTMVG